MHYTVQYIYLYTETNISDQSCMDKYILQLINRLNFYANEVINNNKKLYKIHELYVARNVKHLNTSGLELRVNIKYTLSYEHGANKIVFPIRSICCYTILIEFNFKLNGDFYMLVNSTNT